MPTATKAKAKSDVPARVTHKTDPKKVKKGDVMALIDFVTVTYIDPTGSVMDVKNLGDGAGTFRVEGADLIRNAVSADQFSEEIEITGTEAEKIFGTAHNRPFTVCFIKQGDKKTGEGAGEERVLRGRLLDRDVWRGRSLCEDFDVPKDKYRLRWVDNRTIQYFVLEGVKYTVK